MDAVVEADVFHRPVVAVVGEEDDEHVQDGQFSFGPSAPSHFFVGVIEYGEHLLEGGLGHAKDRLILFGRHIGDSRVIVHASTYTEMPPRCKVLGQV